MRQDLMRQDLMRQDLMRQDLMRIASTRHSVRGSAGWWWI
jgi:hypothetical protein